MGPPRTYTIARPLEDVTLGADPSIPLVSVERLLCTRCCASQDSGEEHVWASWGWAETRPSCQLLHDSSNKKQKRSRVAGIPDLCPWTLLNSYFKWEPGSTSQSWSSHKMLSVGAVFSGWAATIVARGTFEKHQCQVPMPGKRGQSFLGGKGISISKFPGDCDEYQL